MSADVSARSISRTESVDKVRALQRALYRSAKQDPARRFHALYDKVARSDIMWRAWTDVAANQGAPGVDGVSITSIAGGGVDGVRAFLDELAAELRDKSYRPRPLRRVEIPKPGRPGESRPLSIPCVRDRVVMSAAKLVLEAIFEADFAPVSYGFRPRRSAHDALEAVRVAANQGRVWVLDADIKACFDNIDHDALVAQVERRVSDRQMLKLLRSWLRVGIFHGGVVSGSETGTPQGSPLSPLLANIALHTLDQAWGAVGYRHGTMVRYCDDFVVLAPTRRRAEAARDLAAATLADVGLYLHPNKTEIVCLRDGNDGFEFLGFEHRMVKSRKREGRRYLQKWPSRRAMASIRSKIRDRTQRRYASWELAAVVANLNQVLRGWGAYFRFGNSSKKFSAIDRYVHQRLAKLASVKHGKQGRNWATRYNYQWFTSLGTHRLTGTVRYWTAQA